jgi:hypothetical protein
MGYAGVGEVNLCLTMEASRSGRRAAPVHPDIRRVPFHLFQQRNVRIDKNHVKRLDFLSILHDTATLAQFVLY